MLLQDLERQMLAAHARGDNTALVGLYRQAGEQMFQRKHVDAACFYLTHAYIFALETGHSSASEIHEILVAHGREE